MTFNHVTTVSLEKRQRFTDIEKETLVRIGDFLRIRAIDPSIDVYAVKLEKQKTVHSKLYVQVVQDRLFILKWELVDDTATVTQQLLLHRILQELNQHYNIQRPVFSFYVHDVNISTALQASYITIITEQYKQKASFYTLEPSILQLIEAYYTTQRHFWTLEDYCHVDLQQNCVLFGYKGHSFIYSLAETTSEGVGVLINASTGGRIPLPYSSYTQANLNRALKAVM